MDLWFILLNLWLYFFFHFFNRCACFVIDTTWRASCDNTFSFLSYTFDPSLFSVYFSLLLPTSDVCLTNFIFIEFFFSLISLKTYQFFFVFLNCCYFHPDQSVQFPFLVVPHNLPPDSLISPVSVTLWISGISDSILPAKLVWKTMQGYY